MTSHFLKAIGALLALTSLASAVSAAAAPSAAYEDFFQPGLSVCVNPHDVTEMSAKHWQEEMKKRRSTCQIIEIGADTPQFRYWRASCTSPHQQVRLYTFNISSVDKGAKLTISTNIQDTAGKLDAQKSFNGQQQGACTSDSVPFSIWRYLDSPDQASRDHAARSVATDLIYCGSVLTVLSGHLSGAQQVGMFQLGQANTVRAAALVPDDDEFLKNTVNAMAKKVASELAGAPKEKALELAQSPQCSALMTEGSMAAELQRRTEAFDSAP